MNANHKSIVPVNVDDKVILNNLMQLYLHDFSVYDNADVDEQGIYDYDYLDLYWVEPTRFPFFIQIDKKYAGFMLIRRGCYDFKTQHDDDALLSVAEFFIMRKYRRQGVGIWATTWLFDEFAGKWQVNAQENNTPAQVFWKHVIHTYTNAQYHQFNADGEMVFQFTS